MTLQFEKQKFFWKNVLKIEELTKLKMWKSSRNQEWQDTWTVSSKKRGSGAAVLPSPF